MELNILLEQPICFIKANTTGNDPYKDRIKELVVIKFEKDKKPISFTRLYSLSEEDKQDKILPFEEKSKSLNEFFKDCGFIGYDIRNRDLIFLIQEFNRAGETFSLYNRKIVDLRTMYDKLNPTNFELAYKKYCGKNLPKDSSLQEEVFNSVELFNTMLSKVNRKEEDKKNVDNLSLWFNPLPNSLDCKGLIILNTDNRPIFNFGPHKGKVISEICLTEPEYFKFVIISDIPKDTINIIKSIVAKATKQIHK